MVQIKHVGIEHRQGFLEFRFFFLFTTSKFELFLLKYQVCYQELHFEKTSTFLTNLVTEIDIQI